MLMRPGGVEETQILKSVLRLTDTWSYCS